MIYIARTIFLLGSSISTLGIAILAIKIFYEPVLPEVMQGQWELLFVCIGISVLFTTLGQYLGNDLLGVRTNVNMAVKKEYEHYRRQDIVSQYSYWSVLHSIIKTFQIK